MSKPKQKSKNLWFVVALFAACLAAPNATVIKIASDHLDVFSLNALRFGMIALVTIPYVLYVWRRFTKKNLRYALYMGVCMTIASLSYSAAIHLSQASYVSIIALAMPIVFIVYSLLMTGEKVRLRSVMGIMIAALGAFLVVAVPIINQGGISAEFNPLATLLAVVDCLMLPLAIIFSRKSNEHGLPIMASFGVSAMVVMIVCGGLSLLLVGPMAYAPAASIDVLLAVMYSAIFVALIARMLNVASFERIGSLAVSGASYVESLLAILLPLIVLREHITPEILLGGGLIIIGVYFVETVHHTRKHQHMRVMQHH